MPTVGRKPSRRRLSPGNATGFSLVSKVLPSNASLKGTIAACEKSLARLKTDVIDLYLLHWRGGTPLAETVRAFEMLKRDGKIRHWGVSNFDVDDLEELHAVEHGNRCMANQVQYALDTRGVDSISCPGSRRDPCRSWPIARWGGLVDHRTRADRGKHGVSAAAWPSTPAVKPGCRPFRRQRYRVANWPRP